MTTDADAWTAGKITAVEQSTEIPAWAVRVIEEKRQLDARLYNLSAFFATQQHATLPPKQRALLIEQRSLMMALSNVLGARLVLVGLRA